MRLAQSRENLMVMTVSNHLTGQFLILNGHGQKILNLHKIKQDENGQNMFNRRCLLSNLRYILNNSGPQNTKLFNFCICSAHLVELSLILKA